MARQHILVTGSHRSGSTWVGRVIERSSKIRYVQEPFNLVIEKYRHPFPNQFECLRGRTKEEQRKVRSYIRSFYVIWHWRNFRRIFRVRSFKDLKKFVADQKNRLIKRTLMKDPLALLSADWIDDTFHWKTIVLIRHPAAFVASLKVKDWTFNFKYFLDQNNLMQQSLQPFAADIRDQVANRGDIISQGILLWNCLYTRVRQYEEEFKDSWYFVKHETLSMDPMNEFEKIFKYLDLKMEPSVRSYIEKSTTSMETLKLARDSKKNVHTWKERLTEEEISRIKEGTRMVWQHFYSEDDW